MTLPTRCISELLIPALEALRRHALGKERAHTREIGAVHPMHQDSARNLLHSLALPQSDIRDLHRELGLLGLSSLGRAEAHTLSSLDAVLTALYAMAGREPTRCPCTPRPGRHRQRGAASERSRPDPAGPAGGAPHASWSPCPLRKREPGLLIDLLTAGMDVMRIYCAHDDAEAWLARIRNQRAAEAVAGRACRVYADLAGPKLRTGAIRPVGRLIDFKP